MKDTHPHWLRPSLHEQTYSTSAKDKAHTSMYVHKHTFTSSLFLCSTPYGAETFGKHSTDSSNVTDYSCRGEKDGETENRFACLMAENDFLVAKVTSDVSPRNHIALSVLRSGFDLNCGVDHNRSYENVCSLS